MRDTAPRIRRLARAILVALPLAACAKNASPDPRATEFRTLVLSFVSAAAEHDTAKLASLVLDERARKDAALLQRYHPVLLESPETRIGDPYHVTVKEDTAFVFLYAREDGRQEFGTELRRAGSGWRIVRIGFPPK